MRTEKQTHARLIASGPTVVMVAGAIRIELLRRARYEVAYTPAAPVIGFAFDGQTGTHSFASSRKVAFQVKPNHLSFVPPNCDVYSQSNSGGEYLKITLEQGLASGGKHERRFSNIIDARATAAAHHLRRELLAGHGEPLPCEQLVQILEDRVACILSGECANRREASWMTPQRLRRTDDIIEARLDTKLTVAELAEASGLSSGFFTRAFKAAVGRAPHEYIMDRRVARARELLNTQDLALAAIAQTSGFASHAHMTSVFRERLGSTPSDIRRRIVR